MRESRSNDAESKQQMDITHFSSCCSPLTHGIRILIIPRMHCRGCSCTHISSIQTPKQSQSSQCCTSVLYMQILPSMGCVLPEDATLIAPNQLYGSLLSRVYTNEPLRQTWWAAESSSAASGANSIVVSADDTVWAALDEGDSEQGSWQRDVVFTGLSSRMHALLARLFTRCMWLGAAPTRILMVQVVLGAAIDVCSPCSCPAPDPILQSLRTAFELCRQ